MQTLAVGKGLFSLEDSDNNIGSFISIDDVCEILEIDGSNKSGLICELQQKCDIKNYLVDERNLYKCWKYLKTRFSEIKPLKYASLDEYILLAIFRRTFPTAKIEQQVKLSHKCIDFKITYNNEVKYIEFDGPSHFVHRYNGVLEDPFVRIQSVLDETGCELVRWPYWIQRCSQNAKIIFDRSNRGYGALWTTNILFNAFDIPDAANTIKKLTKRFNAEDENGIGYFYEAKDGCKHQCAHGLIGKAKNNSKYLTYFIPKDADVSDYKYWLPKELWSYLERYNKKPTLGHKPDFN